MKRRTTTTFLRPSSMGWYVERGPKDRPTILAGPMSRSDALEWLRKKGLRASTRRGSARFLDPERRRGRTYEEHLARIDWNIKDATEALHNAVGMQSWAAARKYIGQLERLQRQRFEAEASHGTHRTARRAHARGLGFVHHGHTAGATFGRGRLP